MTGRKIHTFGEGSSFAGTQNIVRTPWRFVLVDGRLCAEIWFFTQKLRGGNISLSAPHCCTTIDLPSRKLLRSEQTASSCREVLTFALAAEELRKDSQLKDYRAFCEKLTASAPDEGILQAAQKLWHKTLPNVLNEWFEDRIT